MTVRERAPRAAWLVMIAALCGYFMAVVNRTALGVAGVEALDRFGTDSVGLALLSITQIGAYALLQIPSGRMIDRYGPKRVMAVGLVVMALGQVVLAVSSTLPIALLARVLIGAGDAPIFIGAGRLIAYWFPPRRVPMMVQITALIGQAGQLATAIPVAALLHAAGWSTTFSVLAALTVAAALVAAFGLRVPSPDSGAADPSGAPERERLWQAIRAATSPAGTRVGFWSHFLCQFPANTLALVWGVPFFIQAQGRTPAEASLLITVLAVCTMAGGPLAGHYTARHPWHRSWLVLTAAVATAAVWGAVLVFDTPRPLWQLVIFAAVTGLSAPVSLVGIDLARTFTPASRLGTATGFVNIGGFAATIVAVLAIGLVLHLSAPAGADTYSLGEYRLAFAALALPWAAGLVGVLRHRRIARAGLAAEGVHVTTLREVLRQRRG